MTTLFIPVSTGPWITIPAGSTNLPVTNAAGFEAGQKIGIDIGGNYELATGTAVGKAATQTTLSAAAVAGATNIKVAANSNMTVGDKLTVGTGGRKELVTVTNVGSTGASGTGVDLAAPLRFDHMSGIDVSDVGTGIGFSPPTRFPHVSGDAVQALGSGIALDSPLVRGHPYGAGVVNPLATTVGYQGPPAPNQWFGGTLSTRAGSIILLDASGVGVVDAMVYGSQQSNSSGNGTIVVAQYSLRPKFMIKLCLLLLSVILCLAPGAVAQPEPDGRQGSASPRKGVALPAQATASTPTGGAGAFATKRYRNLFLEAGHSQKEISQKIDLAFQQLFHGDPDTQTVYYPVGQNATGPLAYLSDIHNKDVRSEGMSYGMMIAVQLNKKAEFDALWNWSKTFMYQASPTHPAFGFFSWSMKIDGTPNSESPAPDGEEYWVTALYFAAGRWGNGTGIYNYRAEADRLLDNIKNRHVIAGQTVRGPETDGPQFNAEHKMVRFTPNNLRPDHTDPSYHLPAFYELWARWGPSADRSFWAEAAAVSRDFFQKASNSATGLVPNYANFDGTPVGKNSNFGPDAWRTAANWSVDWSWWAADPRERQLSDRIQAFFESKGMDTYGSQFTLDGNQVVASHTTALVATNAVASLAATEPRATKFVEALWNAQIPSGPHRYYDGMWYLMGLLHSSGEFRIWPPK